jgi:hypothetical protein
LSFSPFPADDSPLGTGQSPAVAAAWRRVERGRRAAHHRMSLDADFMDLVMTLPAEETVALCGGEEEGKIEGQELVVARGADNDADTNAAQHREAREAASQQALQAAHESALCRLHVRFERLHWKYLWELASAHAAEVAKLRQVA